MRRLSGVYTLIVWTCAVLVVVGSSSTSAVNDERRDNNNINRDLIVGGSKASLFYSSFYAVTDIQQSGGLCGATLIHPDILLTAAHCGYGGVFYEGAFVYIGSTALSGKDAVDHIALVDAIYHPDFDIITLQNDVMLIKLESPSSAPPAVWNTDSSVPGSNEELVVVGFGLTENGEPSSQLLEASLNVIDITACKAAYTDLGLFSVSNAITICAGSDSQAPCNGDSGSPLFTTAGVVVGIVSFGAVQNDGTCAISRDFPAGFTRLSANDNFIIQGICDLSENPPSNCSPSQSPTRKPAPVPTRRPRPRPTASPVRRPTTRAPRRAPTRAPVTRPPAQTPTVSSEAPSRERRWRLTFKPAARASSHPSVIPTVKPSDPPTPVPSMEPTARLSARPSRERSAAPSEWPSDRPTHVPSMESAQPVRLSDYLPALPLPSQSPTERPSLTPLPSQSPTERPSLTPTRTPTIEPSMQQSSPPVQDSSSPSAPPVQALTSPPGPPVGGMPTTSSISGAFCCHYCSSQYRSFWFGLALGCAIVLSGVF